MNDINSASIGIVKSNQQSILNYHSVFRQTVNSQQSTVNNNSGATGIDINCLTITKKKATAMLCPYPYVVGTRHCRVPTRTADIPIRILAV